MHSEQHYLTPLMAARSIAIIGASDQEGSVGTTLARNMLDTGFTGQLHFVNPHHSRLYGQPCHARIEEVPQRIDVAVICTPAATVPDIIDACGQAGTRTAIVISAGFAESGPRGASLERHLLEQARRHGLRLLGPNSLGLMRPASGINLTWSHCRASAGSIGFVSQSGALCTAVLDWAQANNVGFSSVIAMGTACDVHFGEILDFLAADPQTKSIFLYIEGVRNARRFMSALRAAARCKPVLLIKVGRRPAGEQAVLSHSGASVGTDDVFEAALRRSGVVRLATVSQMYATAQALYARFQPRGRRLAIITNGGGLGAMAADHADALGVPLAELSTTSLTRISTTLARGWVLRNPIDLGGDADPQRYQIALQAAQEDDHVDGCLVILSPQAVSDPTQTARLIVEQARACNKPLIACWMGETQVAEGRHLLSSAGIPVLRTPEPAVELFSHLSNYYRNQQLLLQTPAARAASTDYGADYRPPRVDSALLMMETALQEGRRQLNEMESKAILAAFQIPISQAMLARTLSEALVIAEEIGLPVVMKVSSPQISEKSGSRGVRLNLTTLAAVRDAYLGLLADMECNQPEAQINGVTLEPMIRQTHGRELRIRVVQDATFGPFISLGCGGNDVAARLNAQQRSVALPPLNPVLIEDLLAAPHIASRLIAHHGLPAANRQALAQVLLRVSEMVCELPQLLSLDIDPLLLDEQGAIAVDARIALQQPPRHAAPYAHMAIHPYPANLSSCFQTRDGRRAIIRPITPDDASSKQAFVKALSPQTRYYRFMNSLSELSAAQLIRMTQIDYDREMALVAMLASESMPDSEVLQPRQDETATMVGEAHYAINPDGESCEFAIVVDDDWQGTGLAQRLMGELIAAARSQGLKAMYGDFLADNPRMLRFVSRLGFVLNNHPEEAGLKRGTLALQQTQA